MPAHRYFGASSGGRRCGLDLLELTRGYEDLLVPRGLGRTSLAVLALVARARHLLGQAIASSSPWLKILGCAPGSTHAVRPGTPSKRELEGPGRRTRRRA